VPSGYFTPCKPQLVSHFLIVEEIGYFLSKLRRIIFLTEMLFAIDYYFRECTGVWYNGDLGSYCHESDDALGLDGEGMTKTWAKIEDERSVSL
jgi:hypothetical protein